MSETAETSATVVMKQKYMKVVNRFQVTRAFYSIGKELLPSALSPHSNQISLHSPRKQGKLGPMSGLAVSRKNYRSLQLFALK